MSAVEAQGHGTVLLTGATGFLGGEILRRYLERDDRRLYALIRAADQAEADERLSSILEQVLGRADGRRWRVEAVPGDIERERLGLGRDRFEALAGEVTDVVHSAASVSFTQPLEQARQINVGGTRRMLEFAERCRERGGLRRFCHVSTAYVAGDHAGEFREDQLDVGQEFRNTYERTKFEAERLIARRPGRPGTVIVRPSIIVGEQATGWTSSFNVLYPPLKAFSRGAYPAIPARRSTPVDIVPVDYVAEAVVELCERDDAAGVFHLVSGRRATTVGRLIEQASRYFRRRAPRVVSPGLYRRLLHPLLVRTGDQRRRRALRRSEALFPYFAMRVRFDDARATSKLRRAGITVPAPESYLDRLLDFAVAARWGRRVPARIS